MCDSTIYRHLRPRLASLGHIGVIPEPVRLSLDDLTLPRRGPTPHTVALVEGQGVLQALLSHGALRAEALGPPDFHRGQRRAMALQPVPLLLAEEDLLGQVHTPCVGLPLRWFNPLKELGQ